MVLLVGIRPAALYVSASLSISDWILPIGDHDSGEFEAESSTLGFD